jgi:hypothetical protein
MKIATNNRIKEECRKEKIKSFEEEDIVYSPTGKNKMPLF